MPPSQAVSRRPTSRRPVSWRMVSSKQKPPLLESTPAPISARRIFNDKSDDHDFVQQLDMIFPLTETFKKCQQKVSNTDALQDHIMAMHCMHPIQLIKLLENQNVMIEKLVKSHDKQLAQVTSIAHSQKCIISDIKNFKQSPGLPQAAPPSLPPQPLPAAPACSLCPCPASPAPLLGSP